MLYKVSFTTKRIVTRYDDKGVKISETTTDVPVVLSGLPASTAKSYEACDNYRIEAEYFDPSAQKRSTYKPRKSAPDDAVVRTARSITKTPTGPAPVSREEAARTGNMSAAINGGA